MSEADGRWNKSRVWEACVPLKGAPGFIVTTVKMSSFIEREQVTRLRSSSLRMAGGRKGDEANCRVREIWADERRFEKAFIGEESVGLTAGWRFVGGVVVTLEPSVKSKALASSIAPAMMAASLSDDFLLDEEEESRWGRERR